MEKNLQLLIEKKINAMILEMQKVKVVEQGVSEMQRACALTLNYYLKAINKLIVSDAFVYLGAIEKSMVESIVVARVPGNGIVIQDDGLRHLSSNSIDRLQALMNEPVYIVHSTSLVNTVISNLLQKKIMPKDVTIATNNQIATVKLSSPSPKQLVQIRLAQQITELLIICE